MASALIENSVVLRGDRPPVFGSRGQARTTLFNAARMPQWLVLTAVVLGLGAFTVGALLSPQPMLVVLAAVLPLLAITIGHLRQLLLATIVLDIALGLDAHLHFRSDMAGLGALGGFPVSASTACLGLLYILWLGEFVCKKGARFVPRMRESLPLLMYVITLIVSMLVAAEISLSAFQIFLYLQMLLLYIYVASTIRTRDDIFFVIIMLLVSLILEGMLMIYVRLTGQEIAIGPISTSLDISYVGAGRLGGTLGSPNMAAAYLAMLAVLAGSLFFTRVNGFYKALAALAFTGGVVALLLTRSRGGWASFAVALFVLWSFAWRGGWLSIRSSIAVLSLTVLLSGVFHNAIITRLAGDDRDAASSRVELMDLAFDIIKAHPLLGVGANNFAAVMGDYVAPEAREQWLYTVHNKYLLVWCETGLLGLAAFIWFLTATLRMAWSCSHSRDTLIAPLASGLIAAVLAVMGHMLVDVFNDRQVIQLMFLVAGLIAAMYSVEKKSKARFS